MQTIREYLKENDNYLEIYLTDNYHIYIDNGNSVEDDELLCIELCDSNGNSVNISCYVDIESIDDDTTKDMIDELKLYDNDSIVCVNYDNGMGCITEEFREDSIIWESEENGK